MAEPIPEVSLWRLDYHCSGCGGVTSKPSTTLPVNDSKGFDGTSDFDRPECESTTYCRGMLVLVTCTRTFRGVKT